MESSHREGESLGGREGSGRKPAGAGYQIRSCWEHDSKGKRGLREAII